MKWSLCQLVWLPPCGQVQLSILIKSSSLRDKLPGRIDPELKFSPVHSGIIIMIMIILPLFIQVCLPRISKKPRRRWPLKTFPRLSRLTVSSRGNERGLMAAARLSGIPLTWPYRRNALQPRVRWGQCRKRPVCGAVSTTYRRRAAGRHPWHHLRDHSSLKRIAVTRVQTLPPSACRTYGVVPFLKAKRLFN